MSYTVIVAGLVSAAVAGGLQFINNRYLFEFQLQRQHRQEERKKLRGLISEYQGRVLESALEVHDRQRRRWDRLVALHLLVLAFIEKCGYSWQQDPGGHIELATSMLLYPDNLEEQFDEWLPQLGLAKEMHLVRSKLRKAVISRPPNEDAEGRARRVLDAVCDRARAMPVP